MYSMKTTLYLAALTVLLLSMEGCSGDDAAAPEKETFGVALLTRGGNETTAYRLLVFETGGEEKCLFNQSFGSGNESVRLTDGTYRFATLSGTEGFDLPIAGTTAGIGASALISLKEGGTCSAVRVSILQEVKIPGTAVYEAVLKPATCLLKLELKDAPEGVTLELANMYGGISLTGSYADNASTYTSYPLTSKENVCLPTKGNAQLSYTMKGTDAGMDSGTFDLGIPLEAGYTYSFTLQWHGEELQITSSVEQWKGDDNIAGDAE